MDQLTIAIPVWERTDFFAEALNSALRQSVKVPVLVVDNASSHDQFKRIVQEIDDPKVTYFRNEQNLGMYGNWNQCAKLVKTPYFLILGDDDIAAPTYAEEVLKILGEFSNLACVYSDIQRFGDAYDDHPPSSVPFGLVEGRTLLESAARHSPNFPSVAMTIRKDLFAENSFVESAPALNQDWLFVYRALGDKKTFGIATPLIKYRVHQQGNALKVGARAYLSTALVMHEIAVALSKMGSPFAVEAGRKAFWIPRNAVIAGDVESLRDLLGYQNPNPFTPHLRQMVAKDSLLKLVLSAPGFLLPFLIFGLRVIRRLHRSVVGS